MRRTIMTRPVLRVRALRRSRRGAMAAMGAIVLAVLFAFAALSVDTGMMVMTQTNMQNAVDAAALAAAQEITAAIENADDGSEIGPIDASSPITAAAREMAAKVSAANGIYIDPAIDVIFGNRSFSSSSGQWSIAWNQAPFNVVRVNARRDDADPNQPDGQLPLTFGWAVGRSTVPLTVSATSFVEARDLVLVLDYSSSMNDDTSMVSFTSLGQASVEQSLDEIWNALVASGATWPGTNEAKFPVGGFGLVNSSLGTYFNSVNRDTIFNYLGLNQLRADGSPQFPFPQAGRDANGLPLARPSATVSREKWYAYIDYVKSRSNAYRMRYGYRTLMDFLQDEKFLSRDSEDLWRTPHYPFHAVKQGTTLFLDFLTTLDFGDEVGLVSYATTSRVESFLNDGIEYVDIQNDPVTANLNALNTIQTHKQAGHNSSSTAMGYGIRDGREMLLGTSTRQGTLREGARATMLIMTDGLPNQSPSGWRMPSTWSWSAWTDYDGNGSADYSTTDVHKQYAFWEASEAIRRGVTIHTMSVGGAADAQLMRAMAHAGGGVWIHVPGKLSIAELESQLEQAFRKIAAKVPPPKLIYDPSTPPTASGS
jgi:Flp pilus assembly protein TadG